MVAVAVDEGRKCHRCGWRNAIKTVRDENDERDRRLQVCAPCCDALTRLRGYIEVLPHWSTVA